jgi:hypothetical protein
MCIEIAKHVPGSEHAPTPVVGTTYTVLDDGWDEDLGDYYCLVEFGRRFGYSQRHFATLPDQPAEEEQEEKYIIRTL